MKIAIGGKGGVGKTTLCALLAYALSVDNEVTVIDADPTLNLSLALGVPAKDAARLTPLSEMKELIESRVGSLDGGMFKLSPKVDDLADKLSFSFNGIHLLVMGTIKQGGAGCACGENILLRSFLSHLLLDRKEALIVDMEAGLEHLGRRTVQAVDALILVVEPGRRSLEVAGKIKKLASDIGLNRVFFVANKMILPEDIDLIKNNLPAEQILGMLSYSKEVLAADRDNISPYSNLNPVNKKELTDIKEALYKKLA